MKYVGHIVSKVGIACDPEKTEVIQSWPVPSTVTHVRQFIGFASYYRKFIPIFSEIAQPLTRLTKKSVRFNCRRTVRRPLTVLRKNWHSHLFWPIQKMRVNISSIPMPAIMQSGQSFFKFRRGKNELYLSRVELCVGDSKITVQLNENY